MRQLCADAFRSDAGPVAGVGTSEQATPKQQDLVAEGKGDQVCRVGPSAEWGLQGGSGLVERLRSHELILHVLRFEVHLRHQVILGEQVSGC